jgi:hypothetical protein
VGASGDLSRRCFLFSRIDPLAKSAIVMLPHPMSILALRGPAGTAGKKAEPAERGDRQFKVLISISLDYCLLPSPLLRLSSAAVLGYRIGSCKFERPNIRARYSYEEFSSETTLSVKDEATDRNEPCTSCMKTVTSVQGRIGAMLSVLCLNPENKAKCNEC